MKKKAKKRAPGRVISAKPSRITVSGDAIQIAKVDLSKDVTGALVGTLGDAEREAIAERFASEDDD